MDQKDIVFYDIYDIWYDPLWQQRWFIIAMLILSGMLCCCGFLLWWRYYHKRRKKITPWEQALQELYRLKQNIHIESSQWYTQLTNIVKGYIIVRYNLSVSSKTDFEIVEYIKIAEIPPAARSYLEKIFKEAALVRFSHVQNNRALMLQDLQEGLNFIHNSIPQEKHPS